MKRQREGDYYSLSIDYLRVIRMRFKNQPEKLHGFDSVMKDINKLREGPSQRLKSVPDDVLAGMKVVLEDHDDLMPDFNIFLPPTRRFSLDGEEEVDYSDEAADEEEIAAAPSPKEKTVTGFDFGKAREDQQELVDDKIEEDGTEIAVEKSIPGYKDAKKFVRKVRLRGQRVWEEFLKILAQVKDQHDLQKRVASLFADDTELLEGFRGYTRIAAGSTDPLASDPVPDSRDTELNNSRSVAVKADQKKRPANIEVCKDNNDKKRNYVKKEGGFALQEGICFFENVRTTLSCEVRYTRMLKLFVCYGSGKIGQAEWEEKVAALIGKHPNLMNQFQRYLMECDKFQMGEESKVQKKDGRGRSEKKRSKSMAEMLDMDDLDLDKCEIFDVSYRILPEEFRVFYKNNTTLCEEEEAGVLNDEMVCARNSTSNMKHHSEQERSMFRLEDDRYEMDMLMSWLGSAVEHAAELKKGTREKEIKKGNRINFIRCVERLYEEQGLEVVRIFNEDPQLALPLLMVRLEQKLKELKDYRDYLRTNIWPAPAVYAF